VSGGAHVLVWEYRVEAAQAAAFERSYGPDGDWARLFRRAEGYLGTQLLRDADDATRYVTLDRWRHADDFAAFKSRFAADYSSLDAQCEALTVAEHRLGAFDETA
jgi:heme-degrading monooxygenase HmoA